MQNYLEKPLPIACKLLVTIPSNGALEFQYVCNSDKDEARLRSIADAVLKVEAANAE